jgi:hypothetical protein
MVSVNGNGRKPESTVVAEIMYMEYFSTTDHLLHAGTLSILVHAHKHSSLSRTFQLNELKKFR